MIMIPFVCADFHDGKGNVLYSIKPADLRMVQDAPESIRQDPLFAMLVRDGSLRVPESKEELKLLENEPKEKTPAAEPSEADQAPAKESAPAEAVVAPSAGEASAETAPAEIVPAGKTSGKKAAKA